jgi:type IV pilus assembly protein PilA
MFQSVLDRLRDRQTAELEGVEEAEAGFTLIELMVVLLIIAILLAIAIPTFLGVTSSANDRAAQSNLTNALTEATAQYQSAGQSFSGISALLTSSAPEYTWTGSTGCGTTAPNCISVQPYDVATATDQQGVVLAAMAKTGTCWYVAQLQAGPPAAGLASTGFDTLPFSTTAHAGIEYQGLASSTVPYSLAGADATGGSIVSTAGTYYAKKTGATTANCNATYPTAGATGFVWGPSFSSPGVN